MISYKLVILIGIGCFILGELCGVFCIELCSANKRVGNNDEIQQRREEVINRSNLQ